MCSPNIRKISIKEVSIYHHFSPYSAKSALLQCNKLLIATGIECFGETEPSLNMISKTLVHNYKN